MSEPIDITPSWEWLLSRLVALAAIGNPNARAIANAELGRMARIADLAQDKQCHEFSTRAAPTSSPYAMRHWRACQTCPNRRTP